MQIHPNVAAFNGSLQDSKLGRCATKYTCSFANAVVPVGERLYFFNSTARDSQQRPSYNETTCYSNLWLYEMISCKSLLFYCSQPVFFSLRCFGMLLSPGQKVRNSDMHLLDMVSRRLSSSQGAWWPRYKLHAVYWTKLSLRRVIIFYFY